MNHRSLRTVLAILAVIVLASPGCEIRSAQEFRAIAGPELQSGLTSIVTGLIDGAFAVVDPDDSNSNSDSGP